MDREYERAFLDLGASRVLSPRLLRVEDANREEFINNAEKADAVYFAGGDQSRLARVLLGSRGLELLTERHASGDLLVGGTSAGASALSQTMIASGRSGLWPSKGLVNLEKGLGFVSGVVIDQHFRERNRQGRLIEAVLRLSQRRIEGIGVDENTAVAVRADGTIDVIGDGAAVRVASREDGYQTWRQARPGEILPIAELTISIFPQGTRMVLGSSLS
jgi:cyanophycinase